MCRLQAVAVRTEDSKILESVVEAVTVDVIELHRDAAIRRALAPTTKLALRLLKPCLEESLLEGVASCPATCDEDLLQRNRRRRNEVAAFGPALTGEV